MKQTIAIFLAIFCAGLALYAQTGNPDRPLKGKWDFQAKKVWEVDTVGKEFFADISDIDVLPGGNILVLDRKNFKIYILDKKGRYLSSFGKRGEGPGELRRLSSLFVAGPYLVLPAETRLHYFSHAGTFVKTVNIPQRLRPRAFVSKDIFISAPYANRDAGKEPTNISKYNLKTGTEKVIAQYRPFEKATATEGDSRRRITVAIVVAGLTPAMTVHYRDGKVWYGMSDIYRVSMANLEGKNLGEFSLAGRERASVSRKFKEEIFKNLGGSNIPGDMMQRLLDGLPDRATYFHTIDSDSLGRVYVFTSDPEKTNIQGVDIFSPGGKYLYEAEIKIPEGQDFIRGYFDPRGFFISGIEDEEGNQKLARFQVTLPPQ